MTLQFLLSLSDATSRVRAGVRSSRPWRASRAKSAARRTKGAARDSSDADTASDDDSDGGRYVQ